MKIGLGDPTLDLQRVAAVREAVGEDAQLMVDAHHCFTEPQAIDLGRELEKLGVPTRPAIGIGIDRSLIDKYRVV